MYSFIILKLQITIYFFHKDGDTVATLAKMKPEAFSRKLLNIIDQVDNGNNRIYRRHPLNNILIF